MFTFPHSIRWRLPLSYGAIALFAVLALGIVLLVILRGYYSQRERAYLAARGELIGSIVAPALQSGVASEELLTSVSGLAFLSQVRVQLLDTQGKLIADSGAPPLNAEFNLPLALPMEPTTATVPMQVAQTITKQVLITEERDLIGQDQRVSFALMTKDPNQERAIDLKMVFQLPSADFFLINGNRNDEPASAATRSKQQVEQPIHDAQGGLLGTVRLSEGPAYGQQIVNSVAWGLLAAGIVAVLLAAGVGLWTSRQLTVPLAQLTAVTTQMAAGDLTVRANVQRADELGMLAYSFNEMAQQVGDTVSTLQRFVADAAHEINTPITALRANLELSPPTPLVEASLAQVMRLEGLVKNLLLLSRLEARPSHGSPLQAEPTQTINMAQLVRQLSESFASRAEQQEINFVLEITNLPGAQLLVLGNEAELTQALQNLLDNALKFCQTGDTIRLMLGHRSDSLQITIEDTGIGVAPDEIPFLFQRFFRARNAAAHPGNGLGLAIVKAIVERHQGVITAENTEIGLRFILRLPIVTK